jgi:hypothetical protein
MPLLRCRAVWKTRGVGARVIPLAKNAWVDIIYKFSDDWWLGKSGEKIGLVQVNRLMPASLSSLPRLTLFAESR